MLFTLNAAIGLGVRVNVVEKLSAHPKLFQETNFTVYVPKDGKVLVGEKEVEEVPSLKVHKLFAAPLLLSNINVKFVTQSNPPPKILKNAVGFATTLIVVNKLSLQFAALVKKYLTVYVPGAVYTTLVLLSVLTIPFPKSQ